MTETHQIQFNNHLVEFIKKLQILIPSEKRLFSKYYKYYRGFVEQGQRVEFICEFIQYLSKYNKEVSICDEGLFSEEESYYPSQPIQLLKGIDFKLIWKNSSMTEGSKQSIWKYLQTLFLIGSFVLKETNQYKDLMKKQQEIIHDLLQNLKYEKQIKAEAEKVTQDENEGFDMSGFGDLFDENNVVTQIAMEIAKEMNLSEHAGKDPMQVIRLLFGQDNEKLQEIISKLGEKLTKVLGDRGLSEQQLLDQAKQMHSKLMGKLKGIPGMANIEKISQKFAEEMERKIHERGSSSGAAPAGTAETPEDATITKQKLEQCQSVIQELTQNLKQNFGQLGLDGAEFSLDKLMGGTCGSPQAPPPPPEDNSK